MPLPSTRVIPDNWSEHHYFTVDGTLTATCTILRPSQELAFDPETNATTRVGDPVVVFQGKCRVQQLQPGQEQVAADQGIVNATHLVVVRWDVDPVRIGEFSDWVHIDTCPDDLELAGWDLHIEGALFSSLRWERDLYCSKELVERNPVGEE